jgi:DNA-binding TFAR19-related protein (PDSD5 family)
MDELDLLRQKKQEEFLQRQQDALKDELKVQQQIGQLESIVRQAFTKDAQERYANLKVGHPQKAVQALIVIAQLLQQARIRQVDDETLKSVLLSLTPKQGFTLKK